MVRAASFLHSAPMTPPGAPSANSSKLVLGGILLLCLLFVVGLGGFIYYMVRPRGELVGTVALTPSPSPTPVNATPGDTLRFRVDASIGLPRVTVQDDDQLERRASQQLQSSQLTVEATTPSGKVLASSCAIYKGRAMSTTTTSGTLSRRGMLNDCSIVVNEPGAWQVRARAAWSSDLELRSATLEIRREPVPH